MTDKPTLRSREIEALRREFAALVDRDKDVLCFFLEYSKDPNKGVLLEPPECVAMSAQRRYYLENHKVVAKNAQNRSRFKRRELATNNKNEWLEPPKPVAFFPSKSGCLYFYGNVSAHSDFTSIAEEAARLTSVRPLCQFTWHQFVFDWAKSNGRIRWATVASHRFTYAFNLPRESVLALASLDNDQPQQLVNPIALVRVVGVVGRNAGRADKLAEKMRRRNYVIMKVARKNYCQRADAVAMFPRHKQRIEEIQ